MRRAAALFVAGSLVVGVAAFWLFGRPASRESDETARSVGGADAGGRREPGADLAVPDAPRKPTPVSTPADADAVANSGSGGGDDVPAPTVFRFRVVRRADATPIAGAVIDRRTGGALGKTDADGRFEIELVSPQRLDVRVHREGFAEWHMGAWGDRTRRPKADDDSDVEVIRLEPGVPVDGRVVLSSGVPVASAWVLVDGRRWPTVSDGSIPVVSSESDAQGLFHFDGLPLGRNLYVEVAAAGHLTLRRWLVVDGPLSNVVLKIPDAGVVDGVVRDAEGRPLGGVGVWLVESRDDESLPSFDRVKARLAGEPPLDGEEPFTVAAADGTYSIAALPSEETRVPVVVVSETLSGRGEPVTFRTSGEHQSRDVRVPRAARLEVTLDGGTAEQRSDTAIRASSGLEAFDLRREDRAGLSIWTSPPASPGTYRVLVQVPDRPPLLTEVVLGEGEARAMRITLPASAEVAGVVLDATLVPVRHAWISWETESSPESGTNHTNEVGAFRLDVWSGSKGRIRVKGRVAAEDVVPGTTDLRIVLAAPAAPVRLVGRLSGWSGDLGRVRLRRRPLEPRMPYSVPVGSDGVFSIAIPGGLSSFLGRLEVGGFAPVLIEVVGLETGETRDLGVVPLVAARDVTVVVHDAAGKPVRGAWVFLDEEWLEREPVTTDAAGEAHFTGLPPCSVTATVDFEGFVRHSFALPFQPGAAPQVVTLGAEACVEGRVVDAEGKPAASETVSVFVDRADAKGSLGGWAIQSKQTAVDGRFRFALGAGAYRIAVGFEPPSPGDLKLNLRAGETKTVELRRR